MLTWYGIRTISATTASGTDDPVEVQSVPKIALTDEQEQKAGTNKFIELSARLATEDIHELGGKAMVRIDLTSMDFRSPAMLWLKDNGTSERVDTEFVDGYAEIELDRFSPYYMAETAEDSESSSILYTIAVLIILILAIAG